MPITINCWPSVSGGQSFVNIEYESTASFDLQHVTIAIPLPSGPPTVNQVRTGGGEAGEGRGTWTRTTPHHPTLRKGGKGPQSSQPRSFAARTAQLAGCVPGAPFSHRACRALLALLLPRRAQCDGEWRFDSRNSVLVWTIDLVDDSNRSGSMEFAVGAVDADSFYPIEVSFSSDRTFCDLTIDSVVNTQRGGAAKYGSRRLLSTSEYLVA